MFESTAQSVFGNPPFETNDFNASLVSAFGDEVLLPYVSPTLSSQYILDHITLSDSHISLTTAFVVALPVKVPMLYRFLIFPVTLCPTHAITPPTYIYEFPFVIIFPSLYIFIILSLVLFPTTPPATLPLWSSVLGDAFILPLL